MTAAPDKLPRTPAGEGYGVGGLPRSMWIDAWLAQGGMGYTRSADDMRTAIRALMSERHAGLVDALRDARRAVASLGEFDLGGVDVANTATGESVGQYGVRDELLSKIDAALARSDASEGGGKPLDGWQDISTAPKDETFRLLFEPHDMGGFIFVGCYDQTKGEWFNNLDFKSQSPTHWRPLPTPPVTAQAQP